MARLLYSQVLSIRDLSFELTLRVEALINKSFAWWCIYDSSTVYPLWTCAYA